MKACYYFNFLGINLIFLIFSRLVNTDTVKLEETKECNKTSSTECLHAQTDDVSVIKLIQVKTSLSISDELLLVEEINGNGEQKTS